MAKYPENTGSITQEVCYFFLDGENQNLFWKNCVRGQVDDTGTSTSSDFPILECENMSKSFHPTGFFLTFKLVSSYPLSHEIFEKNYNPQRKLLLGKDHLLEDMPSAIELTTLYKK
jgi:hypothetical protein